ncbi:MAG: hypothetical protein ACRDPG_14470, partial [Nocardioidaceae bacterium]
MRRQQASLLHQQTALRSGAVQRPDAAARDSVTGLDQFTLEGTEGIRLAQRQRRSGSTGTAKRGQRRPRDNAGILPVLARAVREVERGVQRGQIQRTRFQAIALLARDERARLKADASASATQRAAKLKRIDAIATVLAQTAAREPSLFALLGEDVEISGSARRLMREMQIAGGLEPDPVVELSRSPAGVVRGEREVVPASVVAAQLANPFLPPDFTDVRLRGDQELRLAGFELIGPLLTSFETAEPGAPSCME